MSKGITLNEFIAELQLLAAKHGEKEISSIGSSSGKIAGMSSPFCFNFKGHDVTEFVPAFHEDVIMKDKGYRIKNKVKESALLTDLNGAGARVNCGDLISRSALLDKAYATTSNGELDGYVVDVEDIENALAVVKAEPSQVSGVREQVSGKVSAKADGLGLEGAGARVDDRDLRHVWARVGMTLDVTAAEEKAIFEGDYFTGKEAVMRVIEAGRASVDGETYIPEECIEDFDQEYGTNYRDREEECAWTLDGQRVAALSLDVQKQAIVADVLFDAKARAGEPVVRRDEKEFTLD